MLLCRRSGPRPIYRRRAPPEGRPVSPPPDSLTLLAQPRQMRPLSTGGAVCRTVDAQLIMKR